MIDFPSPAIDGQQVTHGGVTWQWSAATGTWDLVSNPDEAALSALDSLNETRAAAAEASADATAAEAARLAAEAAAAAAGLLSGVFSNASRPAAVAAGIAATPAGALFGTFQNWGKAIDIWKDDAGVGKLQTTKPFGLGELAAQIKAIEGATIEDWPAQPDILIDSLDMFTWDGRLIPNSSKLQSNPPNKNQFSLGTGDIYFSLGGTPITRRITGAGGGPTGVEWTYAGANVNVDVINIINGATLEAGTYTISCVGRSKAGFGAQNIQWYESVGGTTQIDGHVEGAYAAKSFTFTLAARAAVTVRLRTQGAGTTFQFDRFFIWENDGNANPGWSDDSAGMHCKNSVAVRGQFLNSGLFWDTQNSLLRDTNVPLAAESLPVNINDITAFVTLRVPAANVQPNTAPVVGLSAIDGSSPVGLMMGLGNSAPEGQTSDGSIVTTPTALESHRLCLKGEEFHTFGMMTSVETVVKALDGLIYRDLPRTLLATPLFNTSHLGICNYQTVTNAKAEISQIAIWVNRGNNGAKPFTNAQIKAIMAKMKKHVLARGGTMETWRDILLSEGDSRNNWTGVDPNGPGWNWQLAGYEFFGAGTNTLKAPQVGWSSSVLGFPGDVIPGAPSTDINYVGSTLWARRAKVLALIEACHELGLRVFLTWMNDINDSVRIPANPVTYCDAERVLMADYYAALEAGGLGSRLGLFTCMPRHTDAVFEAARPTVNAERRNAAKYGPGVIHDLIDVAADATMGLYSAVPAPPGWVDTLHPNKAGSLIIANYAKAVIAPHRLY